MISNYRFFATLPDSTVLEVFPGFQDLSFVYEREADEVFFRLKVDGQLTFYNNGSNSDFNTFWEIENSPDRCANIELLIQRFNSNVWTDYYNGYLNLSNGNWDIDACTVTLPINPNDEYACWFLNLKKEQNIFDVSPSNRIAAKMYTGTIEVSAPQVGSVSPDFSYNAGTLDITKGWVVLEHISTGSSAQTTWVREVGGSTLPPGDGWIFDTINLIYVRQPARFQIVNINETNLVQEEYEVVGVDDSYNPLVFDNGVSLSDVIDLLNPCGLDVVSNLFSINPDGTNPTNVAYSAVSKFNNLHIWQKSDVKRPNTSENANKGNLTWENFLDFLANTFQAFAFIDGTTLRIEHISYFEQQSNGLDLTLATYSSYLKGTNNYTYDSQNQPIRELFRWMDEVSEDFAGYPISYENSCTQREGATDKEYLNALFSTDWTNIAAPSNAETIADAGFVIAQVEQFEGEYYIPQATITASVTRFNGQLSFIYLHDKFWRHYRPFPDGDLNETATTFLSTRPIRVQGAIQIVLCGAELQLFNPMDLIKTGIGWGYLERMSISARSKICELEIRHT